MLMSGRRVIFGWPAVVLKIIMIIIRIKIIIIIVQTVV